MTITITPARERDVPEMKALLAANDLPTAGIDDHWRTFVVARDENRLAGCGGAETYPNVALIRSIVVDPHYRKTGLGVRIVRHLLDYLSARGLREFFLLTTTAEAYFKKRGFKTVDRDVVHPQLLASREFQDACPDSAVCMRLVMS